MYGKIKLPTLVSDGMVLQRDQNLSIWGYADPNEKVEITFLHKKYSTKADSKGNWNVEIPAQKFGGPYEMKINEITLKNILIGDVWLASGQSNMELPMRRLTPLYQKEIDNANNTQIRFFTVPQQYKFKAPQNDLNGGKWEETNPETLLNFSGVAYFFAKKIQEDIKVPVGIIHTSLGGSPVQAWMDTNSLKKYPEYLAEAEKWKNDDLIKTTESNESALSKAWFEELNQSDIGLHQHWEDFNLNDSAWKTMNIPGSWEDVEGNFDGSVWFRKEITLPKGAENKTAFLNLGRIKDADETYINGKKVGNVTYEYPPRWYDIPAGILKEGKNVIAIRVTNGNGKGQFIADKPYYLEFEGKKINLEGPWKYKVAAKMEQRKVSLEVPNTGLAITIDIGEWNDIHPLNKKTVGDRLALLAEKIAYRKNIVADGPSYDSFKIEGNQIRISFKKGTNNLKNVNQLKGFSIKGDDGKWHWANAKTENNQVVVSSENTQHPTAVRYDWADNPNGNLYNQEGLPASPFTTEN